MKKLSPSANIYLPPLFSPPFLVPRVLLDDWPFGGFMCSVVPFVQATSVYVSAFTMVAIALDRYQVMLESPFAVSVGVRLVGRSQVFFLLLLFYIRVFFFFFYCRFLCCLCFLFSSFFSVPVFFCPCLSACRCFYPSLFFALSHSLVVCLSICLSFYISICLSH